MQMTRLVISFNRHFFLIAFLACIAGGVMVCLIDQPLVRTLLTLGICLAVWFMVASVVASYIAYDASDLYRLKTWPDRVFSGTPNTGILIHAGFDPSSPAVRRRYPKMELRVFDFFDPQTTTEKSIQRAHSCGGTDEDRQQVSFASWPAGSHATNAIFAVSAAHELRRESERVAFFEEAKRVLAKDGKIVVIEQLRDIRNFTCFGVAAFHFLSRTTWLQTFQLAGLDVCDEFRISPFMSAFVLQSDAANASITCR